MNPLNKAQDDSFQEELPTGRHWRFRPWAWSSHDDLHLTGPSLGPLCWGFPPGPRWGAGGSGICRPVPDGKNPDAGKTEGGRRRRWQRMRRLGGITDSKGMSLSKLQMMKDRGTWCAAVHGVAKTGHDWATEPQQGQSHFNPDPVAPKLPPVDQSVPNSVNSTSLCHCCETSQTKPWP